MEFRKAGQRMRNLAGDQVPGEDEDLETVEGRERKRDPAGESVVAEVQSLEICYGGEIRDLAVEKV